MKLKTTSLLAGEQLIVISAVNRDDVFSANLLSSPDVISGALRLIEKRGHASAGAAYNSGLERAREARVVAFIHQDVYLPAGWVDRVTASIAGLQESWAVAGVWGVRSDGQFAGRVWCSGGGREHVGITGTNEVASLDEIVLLLNTRHGLRFDPDLPGFHLYATDLILQARQKGLKSFCIDAPVVHNSRRNPQPLDWGYWAAYRYMQHKWAGQLPLKTCVVDVTRFGLPMYRQWARNEIRIMRGRITAAPPAPDSVAIARRLGYEPAAG
jgi:hypothetical protein